MPIFPYKCKCGHEFETLVGMTQDSSEACPQCGSTETERQIQASVSIPKMYDIKNMDPREVEIKMKHKRHIEHHVRHTGRIVGANTSREKDRSFHPDLPKRFF